MVNDSVLSEYTNWVCMALLDFRSSFTINEPSNSTSQYVNGGASFILLLQKPAIFCCWTLSLNCLHLKYFKMIHLTKELHLLVTQKSENLIWFTVMPPPAWATCPRYQRTNSSAILHDFVNSAGCCISFASANLWVLLTTFNIPSSLMNGSKFTMLLHDFKRFPFPRVINSFPMCPHWADLIISFSAIFIPSKSDSTLCCFVWSNSLADLFLLMQLNSFILKHNTRSMIRFNLGQLEILSSKPTRMTSCTNAASDLVSLPNSGSSVNTFTSAPLTSRQLFL